MNATPPEQRFCKEVAMTAPPVSHTMRTYFVFNQKAQSVKIGRSIHPEKRIKDLQVASSSKLRLLGSLEGDHESRLHNVLADHRTSGEWFEWSEAVRSVIRSNGITGLPPVKDLQLPQGECSVDWIAEAERIAGTINTTELSSFVLCEMLELESWEEDEIEGLVECPLEDLVLYMDECAGFPDSEAWASREREPAYGYCPPIDDELLEGYLIGYAEVKERGITEYLLFFHEPRTVGARNRLREQLYNVVFWTDPFDRTAFTAFVWDGPASRFTCVCTDGRIGCAYSSSEEPEQDAVSSDDIRGAVESLCKKLMGRQDSMVSQVEIVTPVVPCPQPAQLPLYSGLFD